MRAEITQALFSYALISIGPELVPDAGALAPLAEAGPADDAGPLDGEAGADDWPFCAVGADWELEGPEEAACACALAGRGDPSL